MELISPEDLKKRIDLRAMYRADIYSVQSEYHRREDEQDEYDYYTEYFSQIKAFYKDAAQKGNAILFFLN